MSVPSRETAPRVHSVYQDVLTPMRSGHWKSHAPRDGGVA